MTQHHPEHNWLDDANLRIADDIARQGWSVQENYLSLTLNENLQKRLESLIDDDALSRAGIGRDQLHQIRSDVRRDLIFWLQSAHAVDMTYLQLMENLRLILNRTLFLGLFEYEAHFASYPEGGFYKKHYDSLKGGKNRIISTVCYLNDNWERDFGGLLRLYDTADETKRVKEVVPVACTLAVFLSEDIPHEVTPSIKERHSIAGWFRCNSSCHDKADPLK